MIAVLVTGVGGGVGQSILKALQESPCTLIAADGDALATGLYTANRAFQVPYASDPRYIPKLLEICQDEHCKLVFPGLDAELPILSRAFDQFREIGTTPVISSPKVVEIADDKLATSQFLKQHGFPAPKTIPLEEYIDGCLPFPLVLKPRMGGARSKGVFVVKNADDLATSISSIDRSNYVAQEQIDGDEYTCGTITFNGTCYGCIVMRRILRDGDTYKAFVEINDALQNYVASVAEALQPFGPCNFQLRLRGEIPYIFEINARCSGTTFSRALAGFNEPLMILNYLLHETPPAFSLREVTILRYWKELVVENDRIKELRDQGKLAGSSGKL